MKDADILSILLCGKSSSWFVSWRGLAGGANFLFVAAAFFGAADAFFGAAAADLVKESAGSFFAAAAFFAERLTDGAI